MLNVDNQTSPDSQQLPSSGIQNWKPILCEGSILLYNMTLKKTIK